MSRGFWSMLENVVMYFSFILEVLKKCYLSWFFEVIGSFGSRDWLTRWGKNDFIYLFDLGTSREWPTGDCTPIIGTDKGRDPVWFLRRCLLILLGLILDSRCSMLNRFFFMLTIGNSHLKCFVLRCDLNCLSSNSDAGIADLANASFLAIFMLSCSITFLWLFLWFSFSDNLCFLSTKAIPFGYIIYLIS